MITRQLLNYCFLALYLIALGVSGIAICLSTKPVSPLSMLLTGAVYGIIIADIANKIKTSGKHE